MAYNYNNFLRPISPTDRNIQVLDSNGTIRYTVNPFAILNTMVNNNVVKINLKNDKLIILDFYTPDQAKSAIDQLQKQIDALIQNVPNVIDKEIENFVEKYVKDVNFIDPIGGSLRINGNILPQINNTYNLGSSQSQWHSLYVGPQSLFVGGVTISSHNGSILINSLNLGSTGSPARLSASSGTIYTQATFSSGDVVVKGVTISSHNGSILFNSLNLGSVASPMILNSVDGYMTTTATMSMGGAIVSGVTISGYNNSILIDSLNLGSTSSPVILSSENGTFYIQATTQFQQTIELVNPDATYLIAASPSTIQYGFTSSGIWYHSNLNSDYTASFLGVPTYSNRVIKATIVIAQGATAYLPTSLEINEDIYSIKWSNATLPSGTPNRTDIVGFSFINIGGTFSEVLGNISTFGSVI
jgi:hypothetical protein